MVHVLDQIISWGRGCACTRKIWRKSPRGFCSRVRKCIYFFVRDTKQHLGHCPCRHNWSYGAYWQRVRFHFIISVLGIGSNYSPWVVPGAEYCDRTICLSVNLDTLWHRQHALSKPILQWVPRFTAILLVLVLVQFSGNHFSSYSVLVQAFYII